MIVYCNNAVLAEHVDIADSFKKKLIGLMGKKTLLSGQGLFLKNCSSVHCFFMKFPIDVVYLSQEMVVLHMETIQPWHIGSFTKNTKHILELVAESAKGVSLGDKINFLKVE